MTMQGYGELSSLRTIGICGIGQMGSAAAVCFQRHGFDVLLWARDPDKLAAVRPRLEDLHRWMDAHVGPAGGGELGALRTSDDLDPLDAGADVLVDCIAEHLDRKAELLGRFAGARDRGAVFLTMTSGLSITEMGRRAGIERLLVGAHFWNPPHLMPLVEVIRGEDTPEDRFDLVCALIESIGKIAVRVQRDVPGFIGNRLQHAMWREAIRLVQDGVADAEDVDRVVRLTFALRLPALGPLENADLVGLDLVRSIQDYLLRDLAADRASPARLRELVEAGALGVKTGRGFYDWSKRDAGSLAERRDRQIIRQLRTLRELGAL